jgi:hypothetical protein
MKKLSTFLFLIFFSFSASPFADDIKDFEIEGMSIGDSLLDYMSKESILKIKPNQQIYTDDKFYLIASGNNMFIEPSIFDYFRFHLKKDDNFYKIYSVSGALNFGFDGFNRCIEKKNEVIKDIVKIFGKEKKTEGKLINHWYDKTGDSKTISTWFNLDNGEITVLCYDWSAELAKKNSWEDTLEIIVSIEEFVDWKDNLR